jgi:hypothetical protein
MMFASAKAFLLLSGKVQLTKVPLPTIHVSFLGFHEILLQTFRFYFQVVNVMLLEEHLCVGTGRRIPLGEVLVVHLFIRGTTFISNLAWP